MAVRSLRFVLTGEDRTASKALAGVGKSAGQLEKKVGQVGKRAALGLAGIGAASVKLEADFSSKMQQMAAVAGVPAKGIEELSALATKMGAETVFSAGDAADAMLELAKGGLTAAQIKAGALASTMTLAAAGGLEMGAAATYVSNAMNTFGLKAKDANSVAAALAGGANASSASVESLGLALSQVGPGAKTAGLSLQETVAVLAAFDNAGIKGSDAGTSLKTMLSRLVPQTNKARSTMKGLGLDFTNADGSFRSIADISGQLQTKLGKLSAEEKSLALTTLFGSDATRAATVLMNSGSAVIQKYTKATSDQAAAQRVADSRMKGTAGTLEALKGSVETAGLAIGQILAPYVQMLAKHLTTLANAIQRNSGWIVPLVGILATFATAIWAVNKAAKAYAATQAALNIIMALNPIGIIVIALAALGVAFVMLWKKSETFRKIVTGALRFVVNAFLSYIGVFVNGAAKAFGWIPGIGPKLKGAADSFNAFKDKVNASLAGINETKTITIKAVSSTVAQAAANKGITSGALSGSEAAASVTTRAGARAIRGAAPQVAVTVVNTVDKRGLTTSVTQQARKNQAHGATPAFG